MEIRKVLASIVALACLAFLGCQPNFVRHTVSLVEVLDSSSWEPIVGTSVSATVGIRFGEQTIAPIGPTDSVGRVYIPLTRADNAPFPGTLTIIVGQNGEEETLQLGNSPRSVASGPRFLARLIDDDAEFPLPSIHSIVDSNPPRFKFQGYTSGMGVCDNETGIVIWDIGRPGEETYSYEDREVVLGSIPESHIDSTLDLAGGREYCRFSVDDMPVRSFTPFVHISDGLGTVLPFEPYCIHQSDALVHCEP